MLTKRANMPFVSLAAARGDGLHHEFVNLFTRLAAGADATLSESTAGRIHLRTSKGRAGFAS
jgi:hypothetical protein